MSPDDDVLRVREALERQPDDMRDIDDETIKRALRADKGSIGEEFLSIRSYSRTAQQERVGTDWGGGGDRRLCRQGKRQSSEHSAVAAGNDSDACDM
jgi:hypothetical protein